MIPGFVDAQWDRGDAIRQDEDALSALLHRNDARFLCFQGPDPLIKDGALLWHRADGVARPGAQDALFLGLDAEQRPCFAALTPATAEPMATSRRLWPQIARLSPQEAALFAMARSLADWHRRHGYCSACGTASVLAKGGWCRICPSCQAEHFPRVDPVVIMLAEHDDRILLGRQPRFPARQYSALAGFVEPGETLESAVVRELFEEAGVRARDVAYISSQAWPYPSSLMLGAIAIVDDPALTIDTQELEHAFWASRDDVLAALNGDASAPFLLPTPIAIAHHLIRHWAEPEAIKKVARATA